METETVTCECGLPVAVIRGEAAVCADCASREEALREDAFDAAREAHLEDLGDRQRHLRSVGETDQNGRAYE